MGARLHSTIRSQIMVATPCGHLVVLLLLLLVANQVALKSQDKSDINCAQCRGSGTLLFANSGLYVHLAIKRISLDHLAIRTMRFSQREQLSTRLLSPQYIRIHQQSREPWLVQRLGARQPKQVTLLDSDAVRCEQSVRPSCYIRILCKQPHAPALVCRSSMANYHSMDRQTPTAEWTYRPDSCSGI